MWCAKRSCGNALCTFIRFGSTRFRESFILQARDLLINVSLVPEKLIPNSEVFVITVNHNLLNVPVNVFLCLTCTPHRSTTELRWQMQRCTFQSNCSAASYIKKVLYLLPVSVFSRLILHVQYCMSTMEASPKTTNSLPETAAVHMANNTKLNFMFFSQLSVRHSRLKCGSNVLHCHDY